ncbi:MAG: hypothetical protein QOG53_3189 [Frankiales bacterium]|jgi:hypothetical protein|nr:hypothetical protein [Frankiales bacterium]
MSVKTFVAAIAVIAAATGCGGGSSNQTAPSPSATSEPTESAPTVIACPLTAAEVNTFVGVSLKGSEGAIANGIVCSYGDPYEGRKLVRIFVYTKENLAATGTTPTRQFQISAGSSASTHVKGLGMDAVVGRQRSVAVLINDDRMLLINSTFDVPNAQLVAMARKALTRL